MTTSRLWIRNGTVMTGAGPHPADVLVHGETITAVLGREAPAAARPEGMNAESDPAAAPPPDLADFRDAETVDATGLWVLPGGVDAHVHFGMPVRPGVRSLGWRESSTGALLGGTTTIIDFANPDRGETLDATVDRWLRAAEGECLCDYGLHVTLPDAKPERLAELPGLVARGFPTFKAFLAYKGRLMLTPAELEQVAVAVRDAGGRLLVHAEDGEAIAQAEAQHIQTGRTGPEWFPATHPPVTESRAVDLALAIAARTRCPLTLVHLSVADAVERVARARLDPARPDGALAAEACSHHLFRSASLYRSGRDDALRAILSPPLRSPSDGAALQAGLASGDIDLISSDHCEFPLALKRQEGLHGFPMVPNGTGGVAERLIVSYTMGVKQDGLTPARWVAVCCELPALLNGLAGRKGRLAPGHDADIVLFDPAATGTRLPIGPGDPLARLWTGAEWCGDVRQVWRRGVAVVKPGVRSVEAGRGEWLARRFG
jgi:dihydropyrimidinase